MRREDLEHLIRAAATIAGDNEIVVIGSQAILGTYAEEDLPPRVTLSREADLAFWDDLDERKSDAVDGAIGEMSPFDATFGFYAQGVSIGTAVVPAGWETRLVKLATPSTLPGTAWCLEIHDLVLSKLVAGRSKDYEYVESLMHAGMVRADLLLERLPTMPIAPLASTRIRRWIEHRS